MQINDSANDSSLKPNKISDLFNFHLLSQYHTKISRRTSRGMNRDNKVTYRYRIYNKFESFFCLKTYDREVEMLHF